jgi:hypothetical protein
VLAKDFHFLKVCGVDPRPEHPAIPLKANNASATQILIRRFELCAELQARDAEPGDEIEVRRSPVVYWKVMDPSPTDPLGQVSATRFSAACPLQLYHEAQVPSI